MKRRKILLGLIAAASLSLLGTVGCGGSSSSRTNGPVSEASVARSVSESRVRKSMPALAAAAVNAQGISRAVTGVRLQGTNQNVQINDRFHIGSNTKAFTATLLAVYVEEGRLAWNTRLLDVFPELTNQVHPAYRNVTLEQLLSHTSGLPGLETLDTILQIPPFSGDVMRQRREFTAWVLTQEPVVSAGEFSYSNAGYGVAAAMLEKVVGESYESLMRRRIFQPLGMNAAGFGWPSLTDPNSPRGHIRNEDGTVGTIDENDPVLRIPPILAPAGDIHLSINDFARFVQMHLRGLRGQRTLLRPETVQKMHAPAVRVTPPDQPAAFYALGWTVVEIDGVQTSAHNGSADTFYSNAAIQSSRNRAVVAVTNIYSEEVASEIDTLSETLSQ
ncbi:MAG: serine hydrolase domain-containing protein [Armatimonadaceae bacterium]